MNIEDIKKWWKSPVYKVETTDNSVKTEETKEDPLAGK
jgi:hypothetical protein